MDEFELTEETTPEEAGEETEIALATVAAVASDGVTITIDGDEEPGDKKYKVNSSALFKAGDRVKIHKNSGTYIVEYPVGAPMSRYPIPSGGSDGQYLAKDGSNNYALKWVTLNVHGIPSGGSTDQVLAKSSTSDYSVKWMTLDIHGIPSGGTDGQVLVKNGNANYSVKWDSLDLHGIPSGGSDGQYLVKNGATNYSVKWASAPSSDRLTNGTKTVIYDGTYLYSGNSATLGSSNNYWNGCYIKGAMRFGDNAYNPTLGFFGHAPHAKTSVSTTATLSTLITALNNYGLV